MSELKKLVERTLEEGGTDHSIAQIHPSGRDKPDSPYERLKSMSGLSNMQTLKKIVDAQKAEKKRKDDLEARKIAKDRANKIRAVDKS